VSAPKTVGISRPAEFSSGQLRTTVASTSIISVCNCVEPNPGACIQLALSEEMHYRRLWLGWVLHFGGGLQLQGRLRFFRRNTELMTVPLFWWEIQPGALTQYDSNNLRESFAPSFTATRIASGTEFASSPATAGVDCLALPSVYMKTPGGASNISQAVIQMSPWEFTGEFDTVQWAIDGVSNPTIGARTGSASAVLHSVMAVKSQTEPF
jgi:hypothetical protein